LPHGPAAEVAWSCSREYVLLRRAIKSKPSFTFVHRPHPAGALEARRLLLPSTGIKLSVKPGGSITLSKIPLACSIQILAISSLIGCTVVACTQLVSIGWIIAELNSLVVNGRLDIMALIMIPFQDGLTRSAAEAAKNCSKEKVWRRRATQSENVRQCGLGNSAELPGPYGTTSSSRESILQRARRGRSPGSAV